MKIYNTFTAFVLSTVGTPSKDGKATYYKISLMDLMSKEAGSVSCTEEVAAMAVPMTNCECTAVFDNTYNPPSFRVTHVSQLPAQTVTPGGAKTDPVPASGTSRTGQPASTGTPKK